MRFPKQELNIDEYFGKLQILLKDENCHIFIDTNIISQLYRLNENARESFYSWVSSCGDRFHIPNWSVHEYSKRVTSKQTKDYLSELTNVKTYSKEIHNISKFIKGYVGDSMLVGSDYESKREKLFEDIDSVNQMFSKIANAITKHLEEHQQKVHKEILEKFEHHTLDSDIYNIIRNKLYEHDVRFDGKIPPGFKDSEKDDNRIGDLIIWREILDYCERKKLNEDKAKVVFITRDLKKDMVYTPLKQINDSHPVKEDDKIEIAHESLVYEFKLTTKSEDFYIISFYTLVKLLAPTNRDLALSFQVATESENSINSPTEEIAVPSAKNNFGTMLTDALPGIITQESPVKNKEENTEYSNCALADVEYDMTNGPADINACIEEIKTYNWYKQNPAIDILHTLNFNKFENNIQNRDAFFVLGRNVLQAADGSSGSAVSFIMNLNNSISNWPKFIQKSFCEGCLYEVFFSSYGKVREYPFKSSYYETLVKEIKKLKITNAFDFINNELLSKQGEKFTPMVGNDQKYTIEISVQKSSGNNVFLGIIDFEIIDFKINGVSYISKISQITFASTEEEYLKQVISANLAIPLDQIELKTTCA